MKVIIVDMVQVQRNSLVGKEFQRQIESISQEIEADKAKVDKQASDAEQELGRQKATLTEAAWEERRKAAAQAYADGRNMVQDKANRLQIAYINAQKELQSALNPIFQAQLSSRGANMLMDRQAVIMPTPAVPDVTKDVIQALDQKLPTIKVTLPPAGSTPKQ